MSAVHPVLEVNDLSVAIAGGGGDRTHAIRNISFSVHPKEIVCVVGESGSGKSVTAQAVMALLPKGQLVLESGSMKLQGEELVGKSPSAMRAVRGKRIGMVFQEPMTALNPVERVGDQIGEMLEIHTDSQCRTAARAGDRDDAVGASAGCRSRWSIAIRISCRAVSASG